MLTIRRHAWTFIKQSGVQPSAQLLDLGYCVSDFRRRCRPRAPVLVIFFQALDNVSHGFYLLSKIVEDRIRRDRGALQERHSRLS